MKVHQLLAALSYGDAIGNEALAIQRQLRAAGHESDIFAELVHPRVAHLARPLWEYREVSSPETVCIYHFSIGSAAGRLIHGAPDRLVIVYHNITPARFFLGFHPHLAGLCHHGRRELAAFAPRAELGLGDSEFNRAELEEAGFSRTGRPPHRPRPVALRPAALAGRAPALRRRPGERPLRGPGHPEQADRRPHPELRRLPEVAAAALAPAPGRRHAGLRALPRRLRGLVRELGVEEVVFTGHVDDDELYAYYRVADVFLCLSEHEGFCVPLQEAMHFNLPVIAYDAGAVRETLHGGGLLLQDKRPDLVAELLDRMTHGGPLRRAVLESQARAIAGDPGDRLRGAAASPAGAGACPGTCTRGIMHPRNPRRAVDSEGSGVQNRNE